MKFERVLHAPPTLRGFVFALLVSFVPLIATGASSQVTISSGATQNMTCSAGVCAPTAGSAVLNAKSLETMLKTGNVEVTTTGSGGVQALDLDVSDALSWTTSYGLTLDAYQSISVDSQIYVKGASGGLTLITNDGGTGGDYYFTGGNAEFKDVSGHLTINGVTFTLANSLALLASDINVDPRGNFALSKSITNKKTFKSSPIPSQFPGVFEGLGNTVSDLLINNTSGSSEVGLFAAIVGTVRDIGLVGGSVASSQIGAYVGDLAGAIGGGTIQNSYATGSVMDNGSNSYVGGLVGYGNGGTINNSYDKGTVTGGAVVGGILGIGIYNTVTITNCYATGTVTGESSAYNVGGLVGALYSQNGLNTTTVSGSYVTGAVTGSTGYVGGLVGYNYWDGGNGGAANIVDSYATGTVTVTGSGHAFVGGLVGRNEDSISDSYATGNVIGQSGDAGYSATGGLVGYDDGMDSNSFASGNVSESSGTNGSSYVGGLVGTSGSISESFATGTVTGQAGSYVGGLVGQVFPGTISESYSTGSAAGGSNSYVGGLVGQNYDGAINNSYSTGAATGGSGSNVGGLVGFNGYQPSNINGTISDSYSTGAVSAGSDSSTGGLVGSDVSKPGSITDTYWDTDTSGITNVSQGAGNISNDPGIMGLSTLQFQSGLPTGFSSSIWGENGTIDDGFPYLLALPSSHAPLLHKKRTIS